MTLDVLGLLRMVELSATAAEEEIRLSAKMQKWLVSVFALHTSTTTHHRVQTVARSFNLCILIHHKRNGGGGGDSTQRKNAKVAGKCYCLAPKQNRLLRNKYVTYTLFFMEMNS